MLRNVPLAIGRAFLLFALWSCANDEPAAPDDDDDDPGPIENPPESDPDSIPAAFRLSFQEVASGFTNPIMLTAPTGDDRLFVVEQRGVIRIIQGGQTLSTPFLDIRSKVKFQSEQGLLGLAFHPEYSTNGRFYVNYTGLDNHTRVERYQVTGTSGNDRNIADVNSAALTIQVNQPATNHNGGMITFAPDGTLLIGMGDGGGGGDPEGNGQNRATLLGALLRIDVNGTPYSVPATNPFAAQPPLRGEIWAFGLRNPWRFSIDRLAGVLYIGDVGQNRFEEINAVPLSRAGVNYGWNVMEAAECYQAASCNTEGLTQPVIAYGRQSGCSVIGGYAYRGTAIPEIRGRYFYSDYCNGWLRSFWYKGGVATEQREWDVPDVGRVLSFGEDSAGEMYVLAENGRVYRLVKGS